LPFLLLKVALKRPELYIPVRLKLVKPGPDRGNGLRPEAEDARSRIGCVAFVGDEADTQEVPQVLAHRGGRGTERRSQLACPGGLAAEQLDDSPPCRVSEGVEQVGDRDLARLIAVHTDNN
jgi:hypothetical protein